MGAAFGVDRGAVDCEYGGPTGFTNFVITFVGGAELRGDSAAGSGRERDLGIDAAQGGLHVFVGERGADGFLADGARGHDVLVEEGRGNFQGVGNIVEAVADVVGGEQGGGVDINAEEVAHGVRVFGAIETVNADAAGVEVRGAGLVERGFEIGGERVDGFGRGLGCAGGRHHASAEFADGAFPDERVLFGMREVHGVKGQLCGSQLLVMAGYAIAINEGFIWICRGCFFCLLGCCGERACRPYHKGGGEQ